MTAESLAALALEVLDLQQVYFKTRTRDALTAAKRAERRLRRACGEVLHPGQVQPALFDDAPPAGPAH